VAGIRIIMPSGVNNIYAPDDFEIEYLDPAKAPSSDPSLLEPMNDLHWTLISAHVSQGNTIYNNGDRGLEFVFGVPKACYGIRLKNLYAQTATVRTEMAELYIFEEPSDFEITAALVNNVLRIRTDPLASYRNFTINDVGPTKLVSDIVTELNRQIRGYELQAVRSDFGYLWLRGTVAGGNSQVDIDTEGNGSTINSDIGVAVGGGSKTGTTQSVTKAYDDALTITYRAAVSGDLPV
jgi:hypothetical protein